MQAAPAAAEEPENCAMRRCLSVGDKSEHCEYVPSEQPACVGPFQQVCVQQKNETVGNKAIKLNLMKLVFKHSLAKIFYTRAVVELISIPNIDQAVSFQNS